jgi:hypothetical protein
MCVLVPGGRLSPALHDAIPEREVSLGKPVDLVLRLLPTDDESSRTVNMSGVEQTC